MVLVALTVVVVVVAVEREPVVVASVVPVHAASEPSSCHEIDP